MNVIISTSVMVVTYIIYCAKIATAPWKYWQLNARYFSSEHGIFSKLSLDMLIPDRWRLAQSIDSEALEPASYPVFLKPEWGQNARGIHRVDDKDQLAQLRAKLKYQPQRYLLQEAAPGQREFEIFSIDTDYDDLHHDILTITEAINTQERFPINCKSNRFTRYADISNQFSTEQLNQLGRYVSEVGQFAISRMSVRANSIEDLLQGNFHVFEINLFLPMPLNLMDQDHSLVQRWKFIREAMKHLAKATKLIRPVRRQQPIFTLMMTYGRGNRRAVNSSAPANIGGQRTQP